MYHGGVQEKIAELQSEVHWHEEQRLKAWAQAETSQEEDAAASPAASMQQEQAHAHQQALSVNGRSGAASSSLESDSAAAAAATAGVQRLSAAEVCSTAAPARHQAGLMASASSSVDGTTPGFACNLANGSALPVSSLKEEQHQQSQDTPDGPASHETGTIVQREAPAETANSHLELPTADEACSRVPSEMGRQAEAAVEGLRDTQRSSGGQVQEALDLAAMLRRPQRSAAKPLPPVPRFDRCSALNQFHAPL